MTTLFDQDEETIVKYWEIAIDKLIASVRLPFSEEVWDSDKYDDIIAEKAQELWEEEQTR